VENKEKDAQVLEVRVSDKRKKESGVGLVRARLAKVGGERKKRRTTDFEKADGTKNKFSSRLCGFFMPKQGRKN